MKNVTILFALISLFKIDSLKAESNDVLIPTNQLTIKKVNKYVRKTVITQDIQGMSFSVLINGKMVHQKSFGFSDTRSKVPLDETTIFPIASITKLFVATATHELLLSKNISTESNIGDFLPSIPSHWKQIKIKELLSHTSGLPDYYSKDSEPSSTMKAIELVSHLPFEYETGTKSKYNQTGFALLHLLIEELSGVTLQEYLQTEHFKKLGLSNISYTRNGIETDSITKTYRKTWTGTRDFELAYPPSVYGSAGLNSSNEDLTNWIAAIVNEQILPPSHLSHIWEMQPLKNGKLSNFALGWEFYETNELIIVGHGGADTSEVRHFISKKSGDSVTVIWLSNTLGYHPHESVNKVASYFMKNVPQCTTFFSWRFAC